MSQVPVTEGVLPNSNNTTPKDVGQGEPVSLSSSLPNGENKAELRRGGELAETTNPSNKTREEIATDEKKATANKKASQNYDDDQTRLAQERIDQSQALQGGGGTTQLGVSTGEGTVSSLDHEQVFNNILENLQKAKKKKGTSSDKLWKTAIPKMIDLIKQNVDATNEALQKMSSSGEGLTADKETLQNAAKTLVATLKGNQVASTFCGQTSQDSKELEDSIVKALENNKDDILKIEDEDERKILIGKIVGEEILEFTAKKYEKAENLLLNIKEPGNQLEFLSIWHNMSKEEQEVFREEFKNSNGKTIEERLTEIDLNIAIERLNSKEKSVSFCKELLCIHAQTLNLVNEELEQLKQLSPEEQQTRKEEEDKLKEIGEKNQTESDRVSSILETFGETMSLEEIQNNVRFNQLNELVLDMPQKASKQAEFLVAFTKMSTEEQENFRKYFQDKNKVSLNDYIDKNSKSLKSDTLKDSQKAREFVVHVSKFYAEQQATYEADLLRARTCQAHPECFSEEEKQKYTPKYIKKQEENVRLCKQYGNDFLEKISPLENGIRENTQRYMQLQHDEKLLELSKDIIARLGFKEKELEIRYGKESSEFKEYGKAIDESKNIFLEIFQSEDYKAQSEFYFQESRRQGQTSFMNNYQNMNEKVKRLLALQQQTIRASTNSRGGVTQYTKEGTNILREIDDSRMGFTMASMCYQKQTNRNLLSDIRNVKFSSIGIDSNTSLTSYGKPLLFNGQVDFNIANRQEVSNDTRSLLVENSKKELLGSKTFDDRALEALSSPDAFVGIAKLMQEDGGREAVKNFMEKNPNAFDCNTNLSDTDRAILKKMINGEEISKEELTLHMTETLRNLAQEKSKLSLPRVENDTMQVGNLGEGELEARKNAIDQRAQTIYKFCENQGCDLQLPIPISQEVAESLLEEQKENIVHDDSGNNYFLVDALEHYNNQYKVQLGIDFAVMQDDLIKRHARARNDFCSKENTEDVNRAYELLLNRYQKDLGLDVETCRQNFNKCSENYGAKINEARDLALKVANAIDDESDEKAKNYLDIVAQDLELKALFQESFKDQFKMDMFTYVRNEYGDGLINHGTDDEARMYEALLNGDKKTYYATKLYLTTCDNKVYVDDQEVVDNLRSVNKEPPTREFILQYQANHQTEFLECDSNLDTFLERYGSEIQAAYTVSLRADIDSQFRDMGYLEKATETWKRPVRNVEDLISCSQEGEGYVQQESVALWNGDLQSADSYKFFRNVGILNDDEWQAGLDMEDIVTDPKTGKIDPERVRKFNELCLTKTGMSAEKYVEKHFGGDEQKWMLAHLKGNQIDAQVYKIGYCVNGAGTDEEGLYKVFEFPQGLSEEGKEEWLKRNEAIVKRYEEVTGESLSKRLNSELGDGFARQIATSLIEHGELNDAQKIIKATDGAGTDEDDLRAVLEKYSDNPEALKNLREDLLKNYNVNLDNLLTSELSGNEEFDMLWLAKPNKTVEATYQHECERVRRENASILTSGDNRVRMNKSLEKLKAEYEKIPKSERDNLAQNYSEFYSTVKSIDHYADAYRAEKEVVGDVAATVVLVAGTTVAVIATAGSGALVVGGALLASGAASMATKGIIKGYNYSYGDMAIDGACVAVDVVSIGVGMKAGAVAKGVVVKTLKHGVAQKTVAQVGKEATKEAGEAVMKKGVIEGTEKVVAETAQQTVTTEVKVEVKQAVTSTIREGVKETSEEVAESSLAQITTVGKSSKVASAIKNGLGKLRDGVVDTVIAPGVEGAVIAGTTGYSSAFGNTVLRSDFRENGFEEIISNANTVGMVAGGAGAVIGGGINIVGRFLSKSSRVSSSRNTQVNRETTIPSAPKDSQHFGYAGKNGGGEIPVDKVYNVNGKPCMLEADIPKDAKILTTKSGNRFIQLSERSEEAVGGKIRSETSARLVKIETKLPKGASQVVAPKPPLVPAQNTVSSTASRQVDTTVRTVGTPTKERFVNERWATWIRDNENLGISQDSIGDVYRVGLSPRQFDRALRNEILPENLLGNLTPIAEGKGGTALAIIQKVENGKVMGSSMVKIGPRTVTNTSNIGVPVATVVEEVNEQEKERRQEEEISQKQEDTSLLSQENNFLNPLDDDAEKKHTEQDGTPQDTKDKQEVSSSSEVKPERAQEESLVTKVTAENPQEVVAPVDDVNLDASSQTEGDSTNEEVPYLNPSMSVVADDNSLKEESETKEVNTNTKKDFHSDKGEGDSPDGGSGTFITSQSGTGGSGDSSSGGTGDGFSGDGGLSDDFPYKEDRRDNREDTVPQRDNFLVSDEMGKDKDPDQLSIFSSMVTANKVKYPKVMKELCSNRRQNINAQGVYVKEENTISYKLQAVNAYIEIQSGSISLRNSNLQGARIVNMDGLGLKDVRASNLSNADLSSCGELAKNLLQLAQNDQQSNDEKVIGKVVYNMMRGAIYNKNTIFSNNANENEIIHEMLVKYSKNIGEDSFMLFDHIRDNLKNNNSISVMEVSDEELNNIPNRIKDSFREVLKDNNLEGNIYLVTNKSTQEKFYVAENFEKPMEVFFIRFESTKKEGSDKIVLNRQEAVILKEDNAKIKEFTISDFLDFVMSDKDMFLNKEDSFIKKQEQKNLYMNEPSFVNNEILNVERLFKEIHLESNFLTKATKEKNKQYGVDIKILVSVIEQNLILARIIKSNIDVRIKNNETLSNMLKIEDIENKYKDILKENLIAYKNLKKKNDYKAILRKRVFELRKLFVFLMMQMLLANNSDVEESKDKILIFLESLDPKLRRMLNPDKIFKNLFTSLGKRKLSQLLESKRLQMANMILANNENEDNNMFVKNKQNQGIS